MSGKLVTYDEVIDILANGSVSYVLVLSLEGLL